MEGLPLVRQAWAGRTWELLGVERVERSFRGCLGGESRKPEAAVALATHTHCRPDRCGIVSLATDCCNALQCAATANRPRRSTPTEHTVNSGKSDVCLFVPFRVSKRVAEGRDAGGVAVSTGMDGLRCRSAPNASESSPNFSNFALSSSVPIVSGKPPTKSIVLESGALASTTFGGLAAFGAFARAARGSAGAALVFGSRGSRGCKRMGVGQAMHAQVQSS